MSDGPKIVPLHVQLTPETKIRLIQARLLRALRQRVQRCRIEAQGLAADMEVVTERLRNDGHAAQIESVKVAGYHIAQTELRVLVKAYRMVDAIASGRGEAVVDDEEELEDDDYED